jgi:hypothetical protein
MTYYKTQTEAYQVHCQYNDNGTLVTETTTANTRREALQVCRRELKHSDTVSAFATDACGELVE